MKHFFFALLIAFSVHAEDAKPVDPALAFQTARADALEAKLAEAQFNIKDLKMQLASYLGAINFCTADWGRLQELQTKAIESQKAFEKLKEGKP